jgi:hypothetical protein
MEDKEKIPDEKRISPNIHEPLEVYLKSSGFLNSFKRITFSTPEEQEDSNRKFSASLTPLQRMEYLYYLNNTFLAEKIAALPDRFTTLYFD